MVRKVGGTVIETFPGDFGNYHRYNFSVGLQNLNVKELQQKSNLFIYPNPSTGEFYIDLGGINNSTTTIHISDITGRKVLEQGMDTFENSAQTTVDLSTSPNGIYLVKVISGNKVFTSQIIKN